MELWDAYRKDETKTETSLRRGEPVPEGLYHMVAEILVQHEDGDFLMMQRDFQKPIEPGKYEVSAGGSVLQGETAEEGARRELFEETNIQSKEFTLLRTVVSEEYRSIFKVFYCKTDCNKENIRLQKGETISFSWVSPEKLKEMLFAENCKICRPEATKEALRLLGF